MARHLMTAAAIGIGLAAASPAAAQYYGQQGQNYGQPQYQYNTPYQQQPNPYGQSGQYQQQPYGQQGGYGYQQPHGAQQNPQGYGGNTQGGAYGGQGGYDRQERRQARKDLTLDVETALSARGYEVGTVDSELDATSRAAIRAYERDANLPITGQPSQQLLAHIESHDVRAGGGTLGSTAGQFIDRFVGGQQSNR